MLFASSLALAASLHAIDQCNWNKPGADRFTGDMVAAVDHYIDIPPAIRDRLKSRVAVHQYDDLVSIGRDAITGQHAYKPEITGMHFGERKVCREVTRAGWAPDTQLRGLVYCEEGYCLLVPTVCGNLSRVQRAPSDDPLDIEPAAGPPQDEPMMPSDAGAAQPAAASADELDVEGLPPTAAGTEPRPSLLAGPRPTTRWPYGAAPWPGGWNGPVFPPVVVRPPVVIPGVPEPSSVAQLVAGAAVLGAWLIRRRKSCRSA